MKKLWLGLTLGMLMACVMAGSALGMTMRIDQVKNFDSEFSNRAFDIGTITITEDRANELTNGDTFTLALPDGAVWDRDNTRVYRYLDGKLDCELKKNVDFSYDDDRKIKFSFKTISGNMETYEIRGSVKLYGFIGNNITLSLWKSNLASFTPKEIIVADNKVSDQNQSILLSVDGEPVQVTAGDKKKALASIKIKESTLNSFKEDDKIKLTFVTEGVVFDNSRDDSQPYYYPVRWERLSGDKIFTSAVVENSQNASFKVDHRSDSAASIRVDLRSISISEKAQPGDIVLRVKAGAKTEDFVVGKIVEKTQEQLNQDLVDAAAADNLKPKVGRSIFKVNSLQYTFMDKDALMKLAPYSRGGVTFVPAAALAPVLGVTDSNYIWNVNTKKITMKSGKIVLEMTLGDKNALLNGIPFQLKNAPEILGTTICLPLREMAEIFGYTVTWVPGNSSIVLDPPAAPVAKPAGIGVPASVDTPEDVKVEVQDVIECH